MMAGNAALEEQPREADGKFDSYRRSKPTSIVQNEGMASFAFPPTFTTAKEHLGFYMSAPVSSRILSNARFAYRDMRTSDFAAWSDEQDRNTNIAMEAMRSARKRHDDFIREHGPNWRDARMQQQLEKWQNEVDPGPMEIMNEQVEMIVRAGYAYRNSGWLPEDQQEIVDNTVVVISGSGDDELAFTTKEIARIYQVSRWIDEAVTDTDLRVAKAMERLAANH